MKKFIFFSAVLLSLVFVSQASADSEFSEKDSVLYNINEDGSTHVTQNIKVTNKTAEYYTNKYSLRVGTQKITNLKAYDKARAIKADLQEGTAAAITLDFPDQIIGKNSTRSFTIEYDTQSIAQKLGTSWSITIPRVSSNDLDEYLVAISVPQSLGAASTIFPKPESETIKGIRTEYTFSTEQMTSSGVTLSFGDKQVYTLGLTYHLSNTQKNSVYTEIALPMNTPHQTIVYESLNPSPQSIYADQDGNYIARYILKPKESIQVQSIAKAIVYINKQYKDNNLSESQKSIYLEKQPYWESDDKKIVNLASELKTPEQIYRYVVSTLTYNAAKVSNNFDRIGAAKILLSPKNSVCMEFTDLFVALARAAKIPAREINGYAYTSDATLRPASLSQDTLHAWPEYYDDDQGWVQVDPTWENTTHGVDYFNSFDLNHVAFVKKGVSSQTPYPAGAYKGVDENTHDVVVNFISEEPQINKAINTTLDTPKSHVAGATLNWKIGIKNTGNTGFLGDILEEVQFKDKKTSQQFPVIVPPFGSTSITGNGLKTEMKDSGTALITVKALDHVVDKQVEIVPFYRHSATLVGFLYLLGAPLVAIFSYRVLHKK